MTWDAVVPTPDNYVVELQAPGFTSTMSASGTSVDWSGIPEGLMTFGVLAVVNGRWVSDPTLVQFTVPPGVSQICRVPETNPSAVTAAWTNATTLHITWNAAVPGPGAPPVTSYTVCLSSTNSTGCGGTDGQTSYDMNTSGFDFGNGAVTVAVKSRNAIGTYEPGAQIPAIPPASSATDGVVPCPGGGSYTMASGVITGNTGCTGAVSLSTGTTAIGPNAFANSAVTFVSIPSGVLTIGASAFQNSTVGNVQIPSTVTTIGDSAFNQSHLQSVSIPDSVTSLGSQVFFNIGALTSVHLGAGITSIPIAAFQNDNALTTVNFPAGLQSIATSAFWGTNLGAVVLPDSVTSIGESAFLGAGVTSIQLDSGLVSIGTNAFQGDAGLTTISFGPNLTTLGSTPFNGTSLTAYTVDPGNTTFSAVDGALFNKAGTTMLGFPTGRTGVYVIPDSVTSIGDGAFSGSHLTSVTIGAGLTTIPESMFQNSSLVNVTIPDTVTTIGVCAFCGTQMVSASIPNSVTSMGGQAFFGDSALTTVHFGTGLTAIPSDTFQNDNALTTVNFPAGLQSIGNGAFRNTNLGAVVLPDSLTTIGDGAFLSAQVTTVNFGTGITSVGASAFQGDTISTVIYCGTNPAVFANQNFPVSPICAHIPDAPAITAVAAVDQSSVQVTYTAPANDNGSAITGYTAIAEPGAIRGSLSQAGGGTITVSGLQPQTTYTFTVVAVNVAGPSVPSAASDAITTPHEGLMPTFGTVTATADGFTV